MIFKTVDNVHVLPSEAAALVGVYLKMKSAINYCVYGDAIATVAYFLWGIPPHELDDPHRQGILQLLRNLP